MLSSRHRGQQCSHCKPGHNTHQLGLLLKSPCCLGWVNIAVARLVLLGTAAAAAGTRDAGSSLNSSQMLVMSVDGGRLQLF